MNPAEWTAEMEEEYRERLAIMIVDGETPELEAMVRARRCVQQKHRKQLELFPPGPVSPPFPAREAH